MPIFKPTTEGFDDEGKNDRKGQGHQNARTDLQNKTRQEDKK